MKDFKYIKQLAGNNNRARYQRAVKILAESDIPNIYFATPWNTVEMKYWQGFADVIIERGIERVQDVKEELLGWLEDPCWLGFNEILAFIVNNKEHFKELLISFIFQQLENKDMCYFEYLFLVYDKCFPVSVENRTIVINAIDLYNQTKRVDVSALTRLLKTFIK